MALVDGQRLYDLNIELPSSERKKANIYKGTITRIEPSLEAAFVNYGAERHGFLPLKEISSEYFINEVPGGSKPNIKEVLKEGQDIVVQIDKEERGNKGAALTTYVSLAGRFIVLKPNKPRSGGVSRRIVGEDRDLARKSLREIEVPTGMSVILRTAGIDRTGEELAWDLQSLLAIWEAIKTVVVERPSPFLIYRESNAIIRALRDYFTNEIGEILVDNEATFKEARDFVEQVMSHNLRKLKLYSDPVPLFTRYQIETQIESAFAHEVSLPSGGSLVIDHTEALVSIDINSARATKGGDIEATALNTNLEAAEEIARQLRLRDLGGLVVIDFIDMGPQRNQREVENRLREAVRQDRARVQMGKITRFGLLEMSRQRLRPSLGESSYLTCPRCSGLGNIRSVESLALAILRIIGEEVRKERTVKVIAQLPVEVATYLLNEKRDWVQSLESRHDTQVILVANPALETPHYQVRRVRDDQVDLPENIGTSYSLVDVEEEQVIPQVLQPPKPAEKAAIATVVQRSPAPARRKAKKSGPGFWARLLGLFGGSAGGKKKKRTRGSKQRARKKADGRRRGGSQRGRKRADAQRSGERKSGRSRQAEGGRSKKPAKKAKQKPAERKPDRQEKEAAATRQDPRGAKAKEAKAKIAKTKEAKTKETKTREPKAKEEKAREPKTRETTGQEAKGDGRDDARKPASKRRSRGGRRRRRSGETQDAPASPAADAGAERDTARPPSPAPRPAPTEPAAAATPGDDRPGPTSDVQEASTPPTEPSGRPAAPDPADFDDTQPELPVIAMPPEREPAPRDVPPVAPATEPPAASATADADDGESDAAKSDAAATPRRGEPVQAGDGNGEERQQGRLLPWEPAPQDSAEPPATGTRTDDKEQDDRPA